MTQLARSEAIFGSRSRGDSDALSDRDILIVDDRIETLRQRQAELTASGWSVAAYTFKKLTYLSSKGALFLQHLKLESKIIRDEGGKLSFILHNFKPNSIYEDEIRANSSLSDLIINRPTGRVGALWAADVLYVTVRNYGVLELAQQKNYLFSYSDILNALVQRKIIGERGRPHLLKLRFIKSLYRSGEMIDEKNVDQTIEQCLKYLPAGRFPVHSIPMRSEDLVGGAVSLGEEFSAYHRLRNLERTYIALQSFADSQIFLGSFAKLKNWIENPRAYAVLSQKHEAEIIGKIRSFLPEENREIKAKLTA